MRVYEASYEDSYEQGEPMKDPRECGSEFISFIDKFYTSSIQKV